MDIFWGVRVLDIQVVAISNNRFNRHLPGIFSFLPLLPPSFLRLKLLNPHRLSLVVRLYSRWVGMLVIPHLCRRFTLSKKQDIGANAGVRTKHPIRKPDNRVQVTVAQQLLFNASLDALPKQRTIRENDRRSTPIP